jgi:hypothetical protein
MMVGKAGSRRALSSALLTGVIYAALLLVTPGLHHDFACHQKSRTHCTSCLSSQAAPNVDVCPAPVGAMAGLAGQLESRLAIPIESPALFSELGRSPPG